MQNICSPIIIDSYFKWYFFNNLRLYLDSLKLRNCLEKHFTIQFFSSKDSSRYLLAYISGLENHSDAFLLFWILMNFILKIMRGMRGHCKSRNIEFTTWKCKVKIPLLPNLGHNTHSSENMGFSFFSSRIFQVLVTSRTS